MNLRILFLSLIALTSCSEQKEPEPRVRSYQRSEQIADSSLEYTLLISPEKMFLMEESVDRLSGILNVADPNFQENSLAKAWINTAIMTLRSKQEKGEPFPLEDSLRYVHPLTLRWESENRWVLIMDLSGVN
jgi:hypothetical protein